MAQRKSGRQRKSNPGARRQTERARSNPQGWGELPFVPESANNDRTQYSDMIDNLATLTRRNVAATFTLGMAAGLFTAQLARQWTTGMRKR